MAKITKTEQAVVDALDKGVKGHPAARLVTVQAGDVQTLVKLVRRAKFEPEPDPDQPHEDG